VIKSTLQNFCTKKLFSEKKTLEFFFYYLTITFIVNMASFKSLFVVFRWLALSLTQTCKFILSNNIANTNPCDQRHCYTKNEKILAVSMTQLIKHDIANSARIIRAILEAFNGNIHIKKTYCICTKIVLLRHNKKKNIWLAPQHR
jgi:hypothetical protein